MNTAVRWALLVVLVTALIGLLCAPARGEEWVGVSGQGSWRNGERLQASTRDILPGARVPGPRLPSSTRPLRRMSTATASFGSR